MSKVQSCFGIFRQRNKPAKVAKPKKPVIFFRFSTIASLMSSKFCTFVAAKTNMSMHDEAEDGRQAPKPLQNHSRKHKTFLRYKR